ncbi:hypothetical protein [Fodinicola feengrottensis]|uniref:MarR family transcriptional regulator n=1 Tax=Fodinicola feengrottensis TaxID=435914 RepID=A0ABN2HDQ8_9ACTN|nr:hypothetical protein [Fodinicola feengrottensis]
MAAIIVPVGFDNGPRYDPDAAPDSGPEYYEVSERRNSAELPFDAYEVWQLAHVDVQSHAAGEFSRDRLIELAARTGRDANGIVNRLVATGLLVEYEVGTPSAIKVLQSHQLHPTGQGIGNTQEHPEIFRIGRNGEVLLEVVNEVYTFWTVSHGYPSIWDAVQDDAQAIPAGLPYQTAEELGYLFAAAIPMIVASHMGVLEPI